MKDSKPVVQSTTLQKQDKYLKETFNLSDRDLKALEKGKYKLPPYTVE
ncbi:hypothetical protein IID21_00035 [Patescibacteria group bacterium]|nr:hypothetical protein [Patescibacteria group bacterium]